MATPFWLKNIGTDDEPVFERPRLITENDGTPINLVGHKCAPWCVDIDGDGNPDLLCGSEDGKIYVWKRNDLRWDWAPSTRFTTDLLTTTSGSGVVITVDPHRRNRID
jgi:WD40 repeat protein